MRDAYDLLIVGAGTAGLSASLGAASIGTARIERAHPRIALVDKADDIGGTLHISGGHLSAAGTRRQARRGIEDSPEQHLADIERISGGTARMDLVERAVRLAPETIDWLEDEGFEFAEECPRIVYGHEPYSVARTYYGPDEARSILRVLRRLFEAEQQAGRIDLLLRASAARLLVENGSVVGCEVETPSGTRRIRAASTLLATGGVAANPGLFERLHSQPLVSAAWPTSTGDGLLMAEAVGGSLVGGEKYLPTFGGLRSPEDPRKTIWKERPLLIASERPPVEIYVNRAGRRFVAEDEPSIHHKEEAMLDHDAMTFFLVLDAAGLSATENLIVGWTADDVRSAAQGRPGFHSAHTLADLADQAGVDAGGLLESVEQFNAAVERGGGDAFGRTTLLQPIARPPFYAIENHGITLISFAGIDVDSNLRVRDSEGEPVHGLYAAGEALGAGATCGRSFCGGMMLTPALSLGRWLGRRLMEQRSEDDAPS